VLTASFAVSQCFRAHRQNEYHSIIVTHHIGLHVYANAKIYHSHVAQQMYTDNNTSYYKPMPLTPTICRYTVHMHAQNSQLNLCFGQKEK